MRVKKSSFQAAIMWGMACIMLLTGCSGAGNETSGQAGGPDGRTDSGSLGAEIGKYGTEPGEESDDKQPSDGAEGRSAESEGDKSPSGDGKQSGEGEQGKDEDSARNPGKEGDEMAESRLRRPVSPEQPMWIVHIDTWNYADPQKIIDLIPKDILPYVVFNISLSISWDSETHEWLMVHDGYETAKSWLRTCADEGVWAMIQPASGGSAISPTMTPPPIMRTPYTQNSTEIAGSSACVMMSRAGRMQEERVRRNIVFPLPWQWTLSVLA